MASTGKGRRTPYTVRGIRRVPCLRCGAPSRYQWQICALDRVFKGVCAECDVALNAMVLDFFGVPGRAALLARYRKRVAASA